MEKEYIFKSERLGFRNWSMDDLAEFAKLNADPEVMEHFPYPLTEQETADYIRRLQNHYEQNGYNYFAAEVLETQEFIGFTGLAKQDYKAEFTPAVDIGWRLKKCAWGKGYATEAAKKCLEFAFIHLKLENVISTCTAKNAKSERVMKKIGMTKKGTFNHPKLSNHPEYQRCLHYEITKEAWQQQHPRKMPV